MKVFLAGIIQGSIPAARIHDQDWRGPIRAALGRHHPQAIVYCHYEAHPNSISYELPLIIETLEDGNGRAAASDVVVCWLPEASMGTGVEMYCAAQAGAVVIAITPLAGNWVVRAYSDAIVPDMQAFEDYLASGALADLYRRKRLAHTRETPQDRP